MHWTMLMTSRKFVLSATRWEKHWYTLLQMHMHDEKSKLTTHATHNAYSHGLDVHDPVEYLYVGHDLDTNIDTIYVNAAHTNGGMMSSNHFCQISLPPEDCKLILEQDLSSTSTLAVSFCSMHGWGCSCGCRCGAFA